MYTVRVRHTSYRLAMSHPLCGYLDRTVYNHKAVDAAAGGVDNRMALSVSRPLTEARSDACLAMWGMFKAAARDLQSGKSGAPAGIQVETYNVEQDSMELVSVPYLLFMAMMAYDPKEPERQGEGGRQAGREGESFGFSEAPGVPGTPGAPGAPREASALGAPSEPGAPGAPAHRLESQPPLASSALTDDDSWNFRADSFQADRQSFQEGYWPMDRSYPHQPSLARSDYMYYGGPALSYSQRILQAQRARRAGYPGRAGSLGYINATALLRLVAAWKAREPFDFAFSRTLRHHTALLVNLRLTLPRVIFPTLEMLPTEFRVFEPPAHILKNQYLCFCSEFMDLFISDTDGPLTAEYGPLRLGDITDIATKYVSKRRSLFSALSDTFGTISIYSPEFQQEYYRAIKHPVFLDNIRSYCRRHKRKGFEVTEVYSFFLLFYRLCCNAVQYNWPLDDVFLGQTNVRSEYDVLNSTKKADNPDGNVFYLAIYLVNNIRKMLGAMHERLVLGRAYLLKNMAKEIRVPEESLYSGVRARGHGSGFSKSTGGSRSQTIRPETLNALLVIGYAAAEEEYSQIEAIIKKDIIKTGCAQREQRMEELKRASASGKPIDLLTEDRSDMGLAGVIEIPPALVPQSTSPAAPALVDAPGRKQKL